MFGKRTGHRDMADIHVYTASKLNDMAGSLEELAKTFDADRSVSSGLSRADGLAAMQTAASLVCGDCRQCGLRDEGGEKENYYLYYLLRTFEQNGSVACEDMPRLFQETCRRKEAYVGNLNRNLGRATMNLTWKNRFLESRDAVVSQFRELAVILEEFSRQMEQAKDVTSEAEGAVKRMFLRRHMQVDRMLILQYEGKRREAFLTVKTLDGRCVTSQDAADCLERALKSGKWIAARDSRSIINRNFATIRFLEDGSYQMLYGVARRLKAGETVSGDNYTVSRKTPGQVIMSLSDGMGSGASAGEESRRVIELTEQLLGAGYPPRSALKLVNTVLLLTGEEEHPATVDLCCVDLYAGVLEAIKLGACATFILGDGGVQILQANNVPAGAVGPVEPVLMSRKLWEDDRIIMVSDGILEALPGEDKENVLKEYLEGADRKNPQDLAEMILKFAETFAEEPPDDMTVLVGGIWKKQ